MLTGEKIIMILDCSFTNLAAAAAVNEMFWRGIKVFGRYENNAGYFLLFLHTSLHLWHIMEFAKKDGLEVCSRSTAFQHYRHECDIDDFLHMCRI